MADFLDARIAGRRAALLGIVAATGVAVQLLGDREHRMLWGSVAGAVFLLALAVVGLAGVARCRDEETRRFSWEVTREQVSAFFTTLDELFKDFVEAPRFVRAQYAGQTLAVLGLITAEALILVSHLGLAAIAPGYVILALWCAVLGALAWAWGRRVETQPGSHAPQSAPPHLPTTAGRLGALPAVVDTRAQVPLSGDPLIDKLLGHLCTWRPGTLRNEKEYHKRLFHQLRRKLRGVEVDDERYIEVSHGLRRRVDLLLEADTGAVLVELKARYGSGDCQRAASQVEQYAAANLGPVVLVLCDPPDDGRDVRWLCDAVAQKRAQGMSIVTVLARASGPRGQSAAASTASAPPHTHPARSQGTWRPVVAAGVVATLMAAWAGEHPPRGLRALQTPMVHDQATLAPAPALVSTRNTSHAPCMAVMASSFHLRPSATLASVGPEYSAGTQLIVYELTGLTRRASRLYRVQTPDGAAGYAFIAPNELTGACTY